MNPYDPNENNMETLETAYPMPYMGELMDEYEDAVEPVTYAGDTGEVLDTDAKRVAHFERQIKELGDFLLERHDNYIVGSAVETAIHVMKIQQQKIRRLQTVERDYARLLLGVDNTMHQPVETENDHQIYPKVSKKGINLIDPKQGGSSGTSQTEAPVDHNEAYERAKVVV